MATTERDYYELLGVPRGASEQDIKSAFRKLARELHPDVSEAPNAEERFREVAEAYQVLSNSETRELYDRYGHAGLRGGGFTPGSFDFGNLSDIFSAFFGDDLFGMGRSRRARGADIAAEVEIELVEAASGVKRNVPFQVAVACERCSGSGAEPGTSPVTCPACGGAGRVLTSPCKDCDGAGRKLAERRLDVTIPGGIHDGQQIRIGGEGHAGQLGGRSGDVYVRVRVRPDERFVRDGEDIFSTAHLNVVQAALGTELSIETLDGPVDLEFPAGTQPGDVRVLRGRGMPVLNGFGRGDHRVLVSVSVPRRVTEEQQRLLEEFERLSTDETYKKDEGFFDKLKSVFR